MGHLAVTIPGEALRQRIRKRIDYSWTGGSWYPNTDTRYVYDRMRVIQERNGISGGNTPVVGYTRGNDLSGSFEGAGGIGGLLAGSHTLLSGSFSNHNCYHTDGGGNVTYMVNSSQSMVATYKYDPYGNTISSSGTLASANIYRFSSKEIMPNSGLYYYGYRFYDPNLQRWLNRDPIGEASSINLYGFVFNDPVSNLDAWGLELITVPDCTVTAYCDKGPGKDWPYFKPKKKGAPPKSVGPGIVACSNTKPPAYPFGSKIKIYDKDGKLLYEGEIHDTGAGWNKKHHNVDPKTWFDTWLPTRGECKAFGKQTGCKAEIETPEKPKGGK